MAGYLRENTGQSYTADRTQTISFRSFKYEVQLRYQDEASIAAPYLIKLYVLQKQ